MFKLTLIMTLILLALASPAAAKEVVLPAGTELMATSNAIINSGSMSPGDEANFTLSNDVKGQTGVILKGSVIFGRVIAVEKFGGDNAGSKLVIMFDFLQVGDDFYTMSALISSVSNAPPGLEMKESIEYEGTTAVTMKGADINFPEGSVFKIRIAKDIEK